MAVVQSGQVIPSILMVAVFSAQKRKRGRKRLRIMYGFINLLQ
jgi:hypothetical protein